MWLLRSKPQFEKINDDDTDSDALPLTRESQASFLSKITFQWIQPLNILASKRVLNPDDIWTLDSSRSVHTTSKDFAYTFQDYVKNKTSWPLLRALHHCFKGNFYLAGISQFVAVALQAVSPFLIRFIINFAKRVYDAETTNSPRPEIWEGVCYVVAIIMVQILCSVAMNQMLYQGALVGGQSRAVLIAAVFDKAVRTRRVPVVPGQAREINNEKEEVEASKKPKDRDLSTWTNGKLVNLVSTDVDRIDQALSVIHLIWAIPFALFIILALLYVNIQYAAFAGFAVLFFWVLVTIVIMKSLGALRVRINNISDERVSLTLDALRSMKIVKMFAWETNFLTRIGNIRGVEMKWILQLLTGRNALSACSSVMPTAAAVVAFVTYVSMNYALDSAEAFSSLALFNALRTPLSLLPLILSQLGDSFTSIRRVEAFLLSDELQDSVEFNSHVHAAITVRDASFQWGKPLESETPVFQLDRINMSIENGKLVAVIGGIGSGKSSLLAALAGDMLKTSGCIVMNGKRIYCPRSAWIMNATIRENILFGNHMDHSWYQKVIDACALTTDINNFPEKDLTEIGERGLTLSGGQKSRLCLARAVYSQHDIFLLDDIMSTLDIQTKKHIFDNVICGLLKDKCRVLVTNQIDILAQCDQILWMDDGHLRETGTFQNLITKNFAFQSMIHARSQMTENSAKTLPPSLTDEAKPGIPLESQPKVPQSSVIQQEELSTRSTQWTSYLDYIQESDMMYCVFLIIGLLALSQCANIFSGFWLSFWTSKRFGLSPNQYAGVYVGTSFVQAIFLFVLSTGISYLGMRSSVSTYKKAILALFDSPISFFETTPLGRIANSLTKDINVLDNSISDAIRMFLTTLAGVLGTFILLIVIFPYLAILLGVVGLAILLLTKLYRGLVLDLKRYEVIFRSAVLVEFSEAVWGASTVRAYKRESYFCDSLRLSLDRLNSALFLTLANQRWLSIRTDIMGNVLLLVTALFIVTNWFKASPSLSGLVLSSLLAMTQNFQFLIRQLGEVETFMTSFERVHHYSTQLDKEISSGADEIPAQWPNKGLISFRNVQMQYRDNTPTVLRNVSFDILPGERFAVVGRTGAGKSSLITTLCCFANISHGSVLIDGTDISRLRPQELRSKLTIIPQDATLFQGTVRYNMDPFRQHSESELISALKKANSAYSSSSPTFDLDDHVSSEGTDVSSGQRQLLTIARALLQQNQIVLCDEATSFLDEYAEQKIQETLLTVFRDRTIVYIAHRLKTVLHFDRICVMDNGAVLELGTPAQLWESRGVFRSMCEKSGITDDEVSKRSQMGG